MSSITRPVDWYKSSWKDFKQLPDAVQRRMDVALKVAQLGGKHQSAKPLQGFGNARVLEIRVALAGSAYRLVSTILVPGHIIVLHCYQKKSARGITTPKPDAAVILQRLRDLLKEQYL